MSRNLLIICLVLFTAAAAHADTIVGIGPWGSFTKANLYTIDTTTGLATLIGNTGVKKASALTYDSTTKTLYAFTTAADIYSIDLTTGASSSVQYVSDTIGEGGMASRNGLLYTCDGSELISINPATGNWTTIGTMNLSTLPGTVNDISGLAFGPDGHLYGYTKNGTLEDSLIKINPDTAATEFVGNIGISTLSVGGLVYNPASNQMLLSDSRNLYSVDIATGNSTLIGSHSAGISGLAYVPEPATALVLAVGGILALKRRRRN